MVVVLVYFVGAPLQNAYNPANIRVQGEDRDSSDEEWADAYARMDPISQLGWRNRRGDPPGPAEQLLRDVFEAADDVHLAAMSEMVGSRHRNGSASPLSAVRAVDGCMSQPSNDVNGPASSEEVDQEGMRTFAILADFFPHFYWQTCVHVCGNSGLWQLFFVQ